MRVVARTQEGGHYVDPRTVADNFYGNMEKLNIYYPFFDSVQLVDTSETEHKVLVVFVNGEVESAVPLETLPLWFTNNLVSLTEKISRHQMVI